MDVDSQITLKHSLKSVGSAAMLLAMTDSPEDENAVRKALPLRGYRCVILRMEGRSSVDDFHAKINRLVVDAALRANLIRQIGNDIHALMHALEEAKKGIIISVNTGASVSLKITAVCDGEWLAVAMFGKSALHHTTTHDRAGLGVMHI